MNGYIFIDPDGEFAVERPNSGFGTGMVVTWTKDIHQATVFRSKTPWTSPSGRHLNVLEKHQPLQATVSRIVSLKKWEVEGE